MRSPVVPVSHDLFSGNIRERVGHFERGGAPRRRGSRSRKGSKSIASVHDATRLDALLGDRVIVTFSLDEALVWAGMAK